MNPDWPLVALAVWDVVPVVVSTLGFAVLAKLSGRLDRVAGVLGWAATGLVALGGLSKPVFKFTVAMTSGSARPEVLDDTLFWLLAPGFLVSVAGLVIASRRDRSLPVGSPRWVLGMAAGATVIGGVLAAVGSGRAWFFWLLTVATLANVWLVVVLVRWSGWRGDRTAAVCFSASLALVIGLSGAAAALPSTIPVQWAEQTTAVAAQGLFAWGALRLDQAEPT